MSMEENQTIALTKCEHEWETVWDAGWGYCLECRYCGERLVKLRGKPRFIPIFLRRKVIEW